ncbi:hypothetical protein AB0L49_45280 [Streptomyces antimycoticus]|uniref:ABC transporter permease n=1 Tax=Streptomyces antimycoticus TaxID=68175 RepID=UPI00342B9E4D
MTAPASATGRTQTEARKQPGRPWRLLRLGAAVELADRGRLLAIAFSVTVQIFLFYVLWTALYRSDPGRQGGLSVDQAVAYSALGVLISRTRVLARDSVYRVVNDGSVIYWFVRPLAPGRYFFLRSCGETLYGLTLALLGALICTFLGVVTLPVSAGVLAVALASLVLGQIVQYYLTLLVEVSCFWITTNRSLKSIHTFIQDLLSGAIVPMWFFPGWFIEANKLLPFQATLNLPVSVYVGRIPVSQAAEVLVVQLVWCVLLAGLARMVWRAVARHVVVVGG